MSTDIDHLIAEARRIGRANAATHFGHILLDLADALESRHRAADHANRLLDEAIRILCEANGIALPAREANTDA